MVFMQLLISTIIATSVMTIFSYAISSRFGELYKEPLLLAYLISKTQLIVSDTLKNVLGWVIHYLIGFLFVLGYHLLWKYHILPLNLEIGILLGAISGIIGILGWTLMFKTANNEPDIDYKGYYFQLFFAHILFALTAVLIYKLFLHF